MNIPFMTIFEKIIHKYLDLVIISFGILRKDLKKPGSVHWLKKNLSQSLSLAMGSGWPKFFVSLSITRPLFEPETTSPIPVKFAYTIPEQKQT